MSLKALKIKAHPKALRQFARKHNALVSLLARMEGRGGAKITVTAGKIIIEAGSGGSGGTLLNLVSGTRSITLDAATGITMSDTATGKSLTLAFDDLTQSLSLRRDDYCDGTTQKNQMHVASAPYV